MNEPTAETHARALAINLEPTSYGSFAEIGAGQEVARWFLTAGAASGTVAQTISAYDKAVSDDTYGAGTRYVSRERLLAMLDHEYKLLVERLNEERGARSRFFAFADTVATRNFKGDNDQHGWVGLRFQHEIVAQPSDILLHVNLIDPTAHQQQEALGVLGVNLLWSVFNARQSAETFLTALWDGLGIERMEVDVVHLSGPAFEGQDPRAWNLQLLRRQMAVGIVFDQKFQAVEPSSVLRKRPIVVDRGRYVTIEPFHSAMLQAGIAALKQEGVPLERDPQPMLELTLHPAVDDDSADDATVLQRVAGMLALTPALVTDLPENYRLIPFLRRHTHEPIRLVSGLTQLGRLLQSQSYANLAGSQLEGMGKLFADNVKLYVYPMSRDAIAAALANMPHRPTNVRLPEGLRLIGADDLILSSPLVHLFRYLREAGRIVPLKPGS
jgi:hypothetical protein